MGGENYDWTALVAGERIASGIPPFAGKVSEDGCMDVCGVEQGIICATESLIEADPARALRRPVNMSVANLHSTFIRNVALYRIE